MSVVTPQMEIEKLASLGKELGYEGEELRKFIREESNEARDEARALRAEERAHEELRQKRLKQS